MMIFCILFDKPKPGNDAFVINSVGILFSNCLVNFDVLVLKRAVLKTNKQ